ncbi:MAG: TonB-dependent receptor [Chloroflexia bacterium]|nr:TonB-dependent receptor [Chloroflexia bacterium]
MKKKIFTILFTAALFLAAVNVFGQETAELMGKITDSNGEALIGANVVAVHTGSAQQSGTITDVDGNFKIANLQPGAYKVTVSFIGYSSITKEITLNAGSNSMDNVELQSSDIGIAEVSVLASVAVERKTPVAISSIKPTQIEEKLGSQEYPEILKSTPGIYATRQGGGFGDSRVNVRGFDMKNTAVMINGIPVNDMENGWVYWSNWAGLSEVTKTMQVQRGLGASKVSIGSIGGTINIITKSTDAEKGGSVFTGIGSDGYKKTSVTLSTGLSENGWALTFSGARTVGEGWVDATSYESWSYFLNIAKRWKNQTLSYTIFGAPQFHGQRTSKQSIEKFQDPNYGIGYNSAWGYKNGQVVNLVKNFYHKPQMSLNHYIDFSQKTKLATSLYMSFGTGGGTGTLGDEEGKFYSSDYMVQGQVDLDRIVEENMATGAEGSRASTAIIRASRNDHNWYGLLSNLNHKLTDQIELSGGIDLRYYRGKHFREVVDLLGGDYYFDDSNRNKPVNLAKVGDKIAYWNDGEVAWEGVFIQAEYSLDALSAFVSGSFNNTAFRRTDYFNYLDSDSEQTSKWENHTGFVVKGGANYNIDSHHNIFANAGYFERAPFFDAVFYDYSTNAVNEGVKNEKTMAFELGYGYRSSVFSANINGYYTNWIDKFLRKSFEDPSNPGEYLLANIEGVNALHMGVEFDFIFKPVSKLEITGMASLGDWTWQNDVKDVRIYNDDNELAGQVDIYMGGLKVGDAAQTTFAIGLNYEILKGFKIGFDYNYYDNLYAYFDPIGRTDELTAGAEAWEMPAYGLLDANLRYNFKIAGLSATWYVNAHNLLDTEYISDATDGAAHDWQTARVFYGIGRTWTTGLKLTLKFDDNEKYSFINYCTIWVNDCCM